jgi:predicted KAP-like P-loop ATPase
VLERTETYEAWLKSICKNRDIGEKVYVIKEVFNQLHEQGIKLPMSDYDQMHEYIDEVIEMLNDIVFNKKKYD